MINPTLIYFTHSRIRPYFTGCNKRIEETLQDIIDQTISLDIIPLITVIENNGYYFSLNNRRLYLMKQLYQLDLLTYRNKATTSIPKNMIQVYMKPALEREKLRYTIDRCSLTAKIMKEYHNNINELDLSNNDIDSNNKQIKDENDVDNNNDINIINDIKDKKSDTYDNQNSTINNIYKDNNLIINDNDINISNNDINRKPMN